MRGNKYFFQVAGNLEHRAIIYFNLGISYVHWILGSVFYCLYNETNVKKVIPEGLQEPCVL